MGLGKANAQMRKRLLTLRENTPADVPAETVEPAAAVVPLPTRPNGPFDLSEVNQMSGYADLGPLLLPVRDDVEIRVNIDDNGNPAELMAFHDGWHLRLDVFAAPRSEGMWADVAAEIAAGISADGVDVVEVAGPFGPQLFARLPGPDGNPVALRVLGIDGPGWLLRAMLQAPAAEPHEQGTGAQDARGTGGEHQLPTPEDGTGVSGNSPGDVVGAGQDETGPTAPDDIDGMLGGVLGEVLKAAVVRRGSTPLPTGTLLPLVLDPELLGAAGSKAVAGATAVEERSKFAQLPGLWN